MSSLAMAARRRGAPVRLCKAAPRVERMIPMYMIDEEGHAIVAVSNLSVKSFSLVATDPKRNTEMK